MKNSISILVARIYWAIVKRFFKKRQKTYEDWLAKGYNNTPLVSFIIQSHNKSSAIKYIVEHLRNYPNAEIIVIDDGSKHKHTKTLTKLLTGGNEFLIRSNDLYENIMYNKTIRFANGSYIALLQDDDKFENLDWVTKAIEYFNKYPDMAILGGRQGLEIQINENEKILYVTDNQKLKQKATTKDDTFCFVHSVNRAPMLLNKKLFTETLKHIDFAYAPFQDDDTELCLRAWRRGLKVGWYDAGFSSMIAGGMRIWNNLLIRRQCIENGKKLYNMYAPYSEDIIKMVNKANDK